MRMDVRQGDSREVLKALPDASVDSCVSDPPYALTSMSRPRPDIIGKDNAYARRQAKMTGFMGKEWDTGQTAFDPDFWREVYRVLKPGAHLVAMSGTRTYHRLASAVEDAGFEIRDQLAWAYGSGFPKSHNAAVGIAKTLNPDWETGAPMPEEAARWQGWGTAIKPAWEPIVLARKPLIGTVAQNVMEHGTGALNIDGCRVGTEGGAPAPKNGGASKGILGNGLNGGWGKPVPGLGRWPANVLHDGSEEVLDAFAMYGESKSTGGGLHNGDKFGGGYAPPGEKTIGFGDTGTAARFFFSAKADADDRIGSKHPTVKPVQLMRWLVRLVTPKGGVVLDPFAGTGTTGVAAIREGMNAILIEREAEYVADIRRRLDMLSGLDTPLLAGAAR
jgi:DNA modification methylase